MPIDTDVPRPALVGEKNDVVIAFIDVTQYSEEQLERLACGERRRCLRGANAVADQSIELGNEGIGSSRLLENVVGMTTAFLVIFTAQALYYGIGEPR